MLVFGFARKSEIFTMRWRDLDFNNDTWLGRPLSDPAVVLLRNVPQSGAWVFPSHGRHLTDPRTAWKKMMMSAGVPEVQMNDIYKYMFRQLNWTSDREQLRENMNKLLTNISVL
jgi:integrase